MNFIITTTRLQYAIWNEFTKLHAVGRSL